MQPESYSNSGAYDFLNQQPVKNSRKLPLPKLPRLAWIILIAGVGLLTLAVIVAVLAGGNRADSNAYVESLALSREISRVSDNVQSLSSDNATQGLATTISAVLLSGNTELNNYLKDSGVKIDAKSLDSKLDNDVDAQLQQAAQSNRLSEAYRTYLKAQLSDYQTALESAYEQSGNRGKAIIKDTYDSVDIILASLKKGS